MYIVTIELPREKVKVVKLVRKIKDIGLGDAKYFAEEHFCFDQWCSPIVRFDASMTTHGIGRLCHYSINNPEVKLLASKRVDTDFTIIDLSYVGGAQ